MEFHAKEQLPGLLDWMRQQMILLKRVMKAYSHQNWNLRILKSVPEMRYRHWQIL